MTRDAERFSGPQLMYVARPFAPRCPEPPFVASDRSVRYVVRPGASSCSSGFNMVKNPRGRCEIHSDTKSKCWTTLSNLPIEGALSASIEG